MAKNLCENDIFSGLKALSESSFPKVCKSCGKKYATAEEYLRETKTINEAKSGLKAAEEDDGVYVIEAFRNCSCGSTLMDYFSDRRDTSDTGLKRRERFADLLTKLEKKGIEISVARDELIKIVKGQHSEILSNLLNRK